MSTQSRYKSVILKSTRWLNDKHPEALELVNEELKIKVPLPNEDCIIDCFVDSQHIIGQICKVLLII
jgi:hypothetical protein